MRETVTIIRAGGAVAMLAGATLFASSTAQAMALAPADINSAVQWQDVIQQAGYVCRRGSHGRRCYYVSRADQNPYVGNPYVPYPFNQPRSPSGDPPYNTFYWGNGQGGGR
jgi:hypothetical protein